MEPIFQETGYRKSVPITCYSERQQTKILLLHDAAVGDFVIHSGVIREIRRIYPNAYISLLVKSKVAQLAELCPYFDEVILNNGHFSYYNFNDMFEWYTKLAAILLQRKFDI